MSGRDWDKKDKENEPAELLKMFQKMIQGEEQRFKVELDVTAKQMIELGQFIKTVLHMKCPEDHK